MKRTLTIITNKRDLKIWLGWLMERPRRRWLAVMEAMQ